MNRKNNDADYFLDITQDVCPMTFVKARLQIEKMMPGQILEIRLAGREPLKNVPDSLTELGHRIVSVDEERASGDAAADVVHRLLVEKKES